MPINTDLLIAAPMLQDSFVDKNGEPMSAGVITCYQDNSRTTLKNWYYQSGTPGNYTYIRLPNPLTLSAAGTICDINGVDTIPFFYPYSELDQTIRQPYYITIVNHDQTNQITRANFPFLPNEENLPGQGSHENYIINNGFWRNIGTANLTNVLDMVVAPSQHDGFAFPDIHFIKNVTGGQDTVTFTKFPLSNTPILTNDITPEFYINHVCSNSATGETQKAYQFPISLHVNTLNAVTYTVTIQAQNAGGTAPGQNTINLFIYQDTGTGTTSPSPFLIGSITLNSSWTKYEFNTVFPGTAGLTLGGGGDDALYLLVQMPLDISCNINFTRPSIYLSDNPPTNSFLTYDQVDSVISSPRTGDLRTSMNSFYPYGWVAMNDGTIGNASSNASSRANIDTWQLFNLIWTLAKPYDSGANSNPIATIYTSAGAATNYGSTAIADFNANRQLALTKNMGRVMIGSAPSSILTASFTTTFTASSSTGLLVTTANAYYIFQGMPVVVTNSGGALPGNLVANAVYYVTNIASPTTFHLATSYANAIAGTAIAFSSAGTGTQTITSMSNGTLIGEYAHTQLTGEVGSHTHLLANPLTFTFNGGNLASGSLLFPVLGSSNAGPIPFTLNGVPSTGTQANSPNSSPMNVVQPGVFYNIFMKL